MDSGAPAAHYSEDEAKAQEQKAETQETKIQEKQEAEGTPYT
jgi:hypothetical protein